MINLFNDGWEFSKELLDTRLENITAWKKVDIPHDWLIHQVNDLYETSEGWYKKTFVLDDTNDKLFKISFEGVYFNITVYVNNQQVGEWKYGYSTFEFDITDFVEKGENLIVVKVRHEAPNTRWYSGAGIYRSVYLKELNKTHINTNGIYISTAKNADKWNLDIQTEIVGLNSKAILKHTLIDENGDVVLLNERVLNPTLNSSDNITIVDDVLKVNSPKLWDLEEPNLYMLWTEIIDEDGNLLDDNSEDFGFREIKFDTDKGFFLNGKHVKINGVCLHHDLGALGSAVNYKATQRQLEIMKEMGVNGVRTSHNMPSTELVELCDRMGILLDNEAFDMWEMPKNKYDYGRFFNDWYKKDVESWIRRDRNHPSVIMWSIGNEIYDTHHSPRGLQITKMLKEEVLKHDPRQNAYATIGSNYIEWDRAQECSDQLTLSGYNYAERLYDEHHLKYPNWYIYGSETAARVQSRGVYHFPAKACFKTHEDLQCSNLENCREGLADRTLQTSIIADRDCEFSSGQFIWTGIDYLGEPSPYFTKNSYYGQADTAGFLKDSYYCYQASWTEKPVLHLFPHWDFNDGQLIDVMAYSNAPMVELFVNGVSKGVQEVDVKNGDKLNAHWVVPYEKGEIKAVGYNKSGEIIMEDAQKSFGDASKLILNTSNTDLLADGTDMAFVEITVLDEKGVLVANANNRVHVSVTGAGRLVGLDNGDSTDYEEYKGTTKKLFNGKLLAMIMTNLEGGEIKVKVSSQGLSAAEITLVSKDCAQDIVGVSAIEENKPAIGISENQYQIPVRKIQLNKLGDSNLIKENPTCQVTAEILPKNAFYRDIKWSVVTNSGIETNIAKIDVQDNQVAVTAIGDGEFRLRCTAQNDGIAPAVLSEYEFSVSGMGEANINPYKFVSASLHNCSSQTLKEVISGGVDVPIGDSLIGFRGVDFGDFGADEITIPAITWFRESPFKLEIWQGIPNEEESKCIGEFVHTGESIWQTYIPNTFKLEKRIKGVQTICFKIDRQEEPISFKGFEFKKINKAYEIIDACGRSNIYGDFFKPVGSCIEQIGNNVTINFNDMNFDKGSSSITIWGKSRNENDSIHIHFTDEKSDETQMIEFPYSDEYVEKTFEIKKV
ncbi:MAG: glycoside hydrolase family 2 protein, partial [Clostridiales bacterium]|nr:glycoside hydrolase family 2 protein [Clostridiales bacterium]